MINDHVVGTWGQAYHHLTNFAPNSSHGVQHLVPEFPVCSKKSLGKFCKRQNLPSLQQRRGHLVYAQSAELDPSNEVCGVSDCSASLFSWRLRLRIMRRSVLRRGEHLATHEIDEHIPMCVACGFFGRF